MKNLLTFYFITLSLTINAQDQQLTQAERIAITDEHGRLKGKVLNFLDEGLFTEIYNRNGYWNCNSNLSQTEIQDKIKELVAIRQKWERPNGDIARYKSNLKSLRDHRAMACKKLGDKDCSHLSKGRDRLTTDILLTWQRKYDDLKQCLGNSEDFDNYTNSSSSNNSNSIKNHSNSKKETRLDELNRKNEQGLQRLNTMNNAIDNLSRNLFGGTLSEKLNKKGGKQIITTKAVEMFDDYNLSKINKNIENELSIIAKSFYLKLWKQFSGKSIDIENAINDYFKEAYKIVSKYKEPSNSGFIPVNIPKPKTLYVFDKNLNLMETRKTEDADGRAVFDSDDNGFIDVKELEDRYELYSGVTLDDYIKEMKSLVNSWYLVNKDGAGQRLEYDHIFQVEINKNNNFKFRQFNGIYMDFNDRRNPKYYGSYGLGTISSDSYYTTMPVFLENDINIYEKSITVGKFKFTESILKKFAESENISSEYKEFYLLKIKKSLEIDRDFYIKAIKKSGPSHRRIKELELRLKSVREKLNYFESIKKQ